MAQSMFEDQDYVCELKTTMRFRGDPMLTSILSKMRTLGADRANLRLTEEEWQALQSTDVSHGASLDGTELWYQSAFAWSYVCMAQWNRSVRSAACGCATARCKAPHGHRKAPLSIFFNQMFWKRATY